MSERPAFTRREFLGTGLAMVSAAAAVPTFLHDTALAAQQQGGNNPGNAPGVPGDRILLVVQLTGGNDGLNTVVPYGFAEYNRARPRLAIAEKDALKVDGNKGIGLHPELSAVRDMLQAGSATIVQGVGYPNPNRSHFTSMDIWHTADLHGGKGTGWIGRAMDQLHTLRAGKLDATTSVCTMQEVPLATNGQVVKPIAFERANLFRWSAGDLHPTLRHEYDEMNRAGDVTHGGAADQMSYVMRTALDAQVASDKIRAAVAKGTQTVFPGGGFSDQLRMVASMIRAGLPTRVFYVSLGSFDTHSGQADRQSRLLREFSTGIKAFYDELAALGQRGRVLTLAFSEFGRRVGENASGGTDHGTAGPLFLFGDMLRPGLLGDHPDLQANRLDQGDLIYSVDFRSIYAAVLDHWLKLDADKILKGEFRRAQLFRT